MLVVVILFFLIQPVASSQSRCGDPEGLLFGERKLRRGCEPDVITAMIMLGTVTQRFLDEVSSGDAWKRRGVYDRTTRLIYVISSLQEVIYDMIKNKQDCNL